MKIAKNIAATFHYRLTEKDGNLVEDSKDSDPVCYLHGHNNIIPALEAALLDKEAGDSFSVEVAPEDGYGLRNEDAIQRVPTKHLKHKGKLAPGMIVEVQTDQGVRQVVVEKVGKFNVDVDTNHPLAGRTLVFDIEVQEVREATEEEISHGHAHGVGGHQH